TIHIFSIILSAVELINNASLKDFTTFGVEAACDHLYRVEDYEELKLAVQYLERPLILGGGSNILPIGDIHRNVLRIELKGIYILEDGNQPIIGVAAGEVWHDFVMWTLSNELGGVENLSLIPGTMGAAPMQNIGAYGVELESVFHSLQAVEIGTGKVRVFLKEECKFGYRDSIFKKEVKDKYVITGVNIQLSRDHKLNTTYGVIQDVLKERGVEHPTIHDVSNAVISIRQSKLPDPAVIGNAGSFFKNPVIPTDQFDKIKVTHPTLPGYPAEEGLVKVPAGWLIEQSGWKGYRKGNAGCYEKQALVLVNHGGARGEEIWSLALDIISSVREKFQIELSPEVNLWKGEL
ncbi:MAG TPA: UDP-N-acetylmuramate dehydrogenase, partial [Saprospiraceae bacterium]|nr:UDP-N-acetylmuramate dehydrogenase [Saprospiraceae bacterium]